MKLFPSYSNYKKFAEFTTIKVMMKNSKDAKI